MVRRRYQKTAAVGGERSAGRLCSGTSATAAVSRRCRRQSQVSAGHAASFTASSASRRTRSASSSSLRASCQRLAFLFQRPLRVAHRRRCSIGLARARSSASRAGASACLATLRSLLTLAFGGRRFALRRRLAAIDVFGCRALVWRFLRRRRRHSEGEGVGARWVANCARSEHRAERPA